MDDIQNNKLQILGKLAATLSHEIRNPLSVLKLNLDFINLSRDSFPEDINGSIDDCISSINRIQYLIENVLEFSRRHLQDDEEVGLNSIISQSVEILKPMADKNANRIITALDGSADKFLVPKNKLTQVVVNLITNAIEASKRGDPITLHTALLNHQNVVSLSVTDFGVGISAEQAPNIFTDFYTSKKGGTGLGLSVCKSILTQYRATISFTSNEGEGTTFTILFPLDRTENNNGNPNTHH